MGCDCGKPKCDGHCGVSPAVLQINNPSECILFHRVEVPASMGDSKTNPPKSGAYKNVLLYYEADQTSWLYSSDGVPQKLVNGVTNYEDAINLPQINGVTLLGNKSLGDLGITDAIDDAVAAEKAEREAADEALGGEIDVINDELLSRAVVFDTVADMKQATNLVDGSYARTLGFHSINDGGGALYKITGTGTANEMDIIAVGTLTANLVLPAIATPEMFGASGGADDTNYLKRCFAVAKNIKFGQNYTITDRIDILSGTTLDGNGYTVTNNTAVNCFRANTQNNINVHNLNIVGDNTVSEAQIGINFTGCNRVSVENVYIQSTGGDGVYFNDCKDCSLKNAKLNDNFISAFAYNSYNISFENINVYKPRFRYGIQFKSCNDSVMRNVLVDTPQDIGAYVNIGEEEGSNTSANILLDNIKIKNEGADGTLTTTIRCGICVANGTDFTVTNSSVENSTYGGIDVRSSNTTISNCIIKNNAYTGINVTGGSDITIQNCKLIENIFDGIRADVNNLTIVGCYLKDNSDNSARGNITLNTSEHIVIDSNILIMSSTGTTNNNIRNVGSISHTRITNNVFINDKTGSSYADYRGTYDYTSGIFANNGKTRLHYIRGTNTLDCYATIQNGIVIIYGYRISIPSYTGFLAGDRFTNNSGSGYEGWIYDGTAWHGYGAIAS